MNRIAIVALIAALAACTSAQEEAEQRRQAEQAVQAHFHQRCVSYGLDPGTADYALCRQQFDLARQQEMQARRALIVPMLMR